MRLNSTLPIRHQSIFAALSLNGQKAVDKYLLLLYLPHTNALSFLSKKLASRYNLYTNYLGFKLSKKFAHAVIRNQVRRRLRAIYVQYMQVQTNKASPDLPLGYLAIIPRLASKDISYQQLEQSFNFGINKIISSDNTCKQSKKHYFYTTSV